MPGSTKTQIIPNSHSLGSYLFGAYMLLWHSSFKDVSYIWQ